MSGANDTKIQWLRAGSSTLWSVLSTLGPGGHGQTRARAREGQKGAPGRSKWGAFGVFFEKNQKIPKIKKRGFFLVFHFFIFSCFSFFLFSFFFIFSFFSCFHFFSVVFKMWSLLRFFHSPLFGGQCGLIWYVFLHCSYCRYQPHLWIWFSRYRCQ